MTIRFNSQTPGWSWLSNFSPHPVAWGDLIYPTLEHAYQAGKYVDPLLWDKLRSAPTAKAAKFLGRKHPITRENWNSFRVEHMEALLHDKFTRHSSLKTQLLATGEQELVHYCPWGDSFWGVTDIGGKNVMGRLLQSIRSSIAEVKQIILFGTGHRPKDLVPKSIYPYSTEVFNRLVDMARVNLQALQPKLVISGMALGWDMALAQAAIDVGIPFHAYVPCKSQENRWPSHSQRYYRKLLSQAADQHLSSQLTYDEDTACMQRRNVDMINASTFCLALWNGNPGGTGNCMRVVQQRGVQVRNLWDAWVKYSGFYPAPVGC
jgi:ribA/ribD-fused uncharacterized protein